MAVVKGSFAHVVGTFDLPEGTGSIDYVTPVRTATRSLAGGDDRLRLRGLDQAGRTLFDLAANPQYNSCQPRTDAGTYEEFVPVSPDLVRIVLEVGGRLAAEYRRGPAGAPGPIVLGAASAEAPHRVPLRAATATAVGVTYTVQAKPEGSPLWQTIGVGLPTPDADVDVNQFPGAVSVDVRVLRSDGFTEVEVFRDRKVL
jgi:hypothetical protein